MMKKKFLIIAVLFGLALSNSAQGDGKREMPSAEKMTERMKTQLELTEEQYKSVYMANEEMVKMMAEAGGREADKETQKRIKKQHMAKLNEILTPEQMAKMKDQVQQRERKRKHSKVEKVEE
jgi:hypothetical protein